MATLQPGEKSRMYALGGLARGGAFRGGYVSGKVFIGIDGTHQGFGRAAGVHTGTIVESLRITDILDETPTKCLFRVHGYAETTGSEIIITLGTKNSLTRLFAGYITNTNQIYAADKPANVQTDCSAIDYTWLLSFLKVTTRYTTTSATAIIQDLITRYAASSGFTAAAVAPNLPVLDEITFTEEELPDAITRIMRRIGGYWYVDYLLNVHAFLDTEPNGNGAPAPLTPTHKSLAQFVYAMDRSQVLTRVSVEGRGSRLLSHVAIGDTMLPLDTVEMFELASDVYLKASFQGSEGGAQYLTFTGRVQGGTGSLVGPGIAPPGAPTTAPATGTGLGQGRYQYAYTFKTAAGETLPSPIAAVDVGTPFTAPDVAPPLALLQSATGVDVGSHGWVYTYVSSGGGETTPSPFAAIASTQQPLTPTGGISQFEKLTGGSLPSGIYNYRVTYIGDGGGETTAAVYGSPAILEIGKTQFRLTIGWTFAFGTAQHDIPPGVAQVKVYRSPVAQDYTYQNGPFYFAGVATLSPGAAPDGSTNAVFLDNVPQASLGAPIPTTNTATVSNRKVRVFTPASGNPNITAAKIYRTHANAAAPYQLVAQVSGAQGAVTYDDVIADAALGAQPPVANTAGAEYRAVLVAQIAAGPPGTTDRYLYRTTVNGAQLRLMTGFGNNTTTSYLDQVPDASLQGNAPASDTSGLTQPQGQVAAGATSVPIANAAVFESAGGWAVIGNGEQVIRYAGHTSTTLTGIPASGIGAITAAIVFNSTVTTAPMLTGIPSSGARAISKRNLTAGDEIYLVVQCDDTARQAALAADMHRGTGIRETWIQDRRLSVTEARARGQATLALHPLDDTRVSYTCRDLRTAAGKTITVNLPAPTNVSGSFKIQQVTIGNFRPRGEQYPTFTVDASNRQFSFEDLLRRTKTKD